MRSYRWYNCSTKGELPACSSIIWAGRVCPATKVFEQHHTPWSHTGQVGQHSTSLRSAVMCITDSLRYSSPPVRITSLQLLICTDSSVPKHMNSYKLHWETSAIRVSWQAGMSPLPYHLLLQHMLALGTPAGSPAVASHAAYSLLQPRGQVEETWTLQGQQLLSTGSSARLPIQRAREISKSIQNSSVFHFCDNW